MKKGRLFKPVVIGFGVWLPILAVVQVYLLIASWFNTPASEFLRIPFVSRLFTHVPFLAFIQHIFGVAVILALVAVVFFLTGSFVMTWLGKKLRYRVETHLLSFLPLYKFFRKAVILFAGENGDVPFLSRFERAAFVHVYGNETFMTALVMAGGESSHALSTAYVPAVPNVAAGRIYNTPIAWVHFLNISASDSVAPVFMWGVGTHDLISRYVAERIADGRRIPECFLGEKCPLEREIAHALESLSPEIER